MRIVERAISIPTLCGGKSVLGHFQNGLAFHLKENEVPVRFAVSKSGDTHFTCEVGVITDPVSADIFQAAGLFDFRRRQIETAQSFNAVLIVPTGIGAEIGGHAGDATPVARMLAESCDRLVVHPNVVNASDINEMPDNALYVEGSIITRMLMGTVGLQSVRSNRVLVVLDDHPDKHFVNAAVNAVSAARATIGFNCSEVICLDPPLCMRAEYSDSGSAVGRVNELERCLDVLLEAPDSYDAVAMASVIQVPFEYHVEYFKSGGRMTNPWGGVEAMLTHALSSIIDKPTAHSPMMESIKVEQIETGLVEPRMAAEAISMAFLQCTLKGLHRSPRIVRDFTLFARDDVFSVEDVSCLVIPDGCFGMPVIAALEQGIKVIAVKENRNLMRNDLGLLPWADGQFSRVENYLEAVGVMNAIRAGVTLESVRRPISMTSMRSTKTERSSSVNNTVVMDQKETRSIS